MGNVAPLLARIKRLEDEITRLRAANERLNRRRLWMPVVGDYDDG